MVELQDEVWLRAADIVGDEMVVRFVDEGHITKKEDTGFDEDGFEIGVTLPNGEKREWTMNKSARRAVAAKYGRQTSAWVGNEVFIYSQRSKINGRDVYAIYARTQ